MEMKKITLIIEKSKDRKWWGRVQVDDNLIIDYASSTDALEKRIKKLLLDFHELNPSTIEFERVYDLSAVFEQMDYLNVSAIALRAGISPGLMRQYTAGLKYPSLERAKAIEKAINDIGQTLAEVKITVVKNKRAAQVGESVKKK